MTKLKNTSLIFKSFISSHIQLTDEEWKVISNEIKIRTVNRNEHLIKKGEVCTKVWFVTSGLIRYYETDSEDNERTTCFALENNFSTPFTSFLKNSPSHEYLIALEKTQIVEIEKAKFFKFVETMPIINSLYRKMLEYSYLQMTRQNYIILNNNALDRYKKLIIEDCPELLKRVPLNYLASYLGISPETLSRVRSKI